MRLFGCAVGRAAPFMRKLKEALGTRCIVTAPNHLLVGAEFSGGKGKSFFTGQLAYMAYAFRLYLVPAEDAARQEAPGTEEEGHRRRVRGRDEGGGGQGQGEEADPGSDQREPAGPAHAAGPHVRDEGAVERVGSGQPRGSPLVPAGSIPPEGGPARDQEHGAAARVPGQDERAAAVPGAPGPPLVDKPQTMPLPKDPGDDAGRKKAVKAWLQGAAGLSTEKHPFPAYVRAGYETMDEFMDGWDWQFDYDAKTKR